PLPVAIVRYSVKEYEACRHPEQPAFVPVLPTAPAHASYVRGPASTRKRASASNAPKANRHASASIRDGLAYLPLIHLTPALRQDRFRKHEHSTFVTLSFSKCVGMGA